jgi:hypothetical protein
VYEIKIEIIQLQDLQQLDCDTIVFILISNSQALNIEFQDTLFPQKKDATG